MSVYGVDVMQSWTDSRLAAVTHDVADHRLYGDDVNVVWTPSLHVVNARRRDAAADHRVLAVSTAGLVILHQRYPLLQLPDDLFSFEYIMATLGVYSNDISPSHLRSLKVIRNNTLE